MRKMTASLVALSENAPIWSGFEVELPVVKTLPALTTIPAAVSLPVPPNARAQVHVPSLVEAVATKICEVPLPSIVAAPKAAVVLKKWPVT